MLIIKGLFEKSAIDWGSVESIIFDDRSNAPDTNLKIVTKSGSLVSITNPQDETGCAIDFEMVVTAKLDTYTCWRITENYPTVGIPTGMPAQVYD